MTIHKALRRSCTSTSTTSPLSALLQFIATSAATASDLLTWRKDGWLLPEMIGKYNASHILPGLDNGVSLRARSRFLRGCEMILFEGHFACKHNAIIRQSLNGLRVVGLLQSRCSAETYGQFNRKSRVRLCHVQASWACQSIPSLGERSGRASISWSVAEW